jgi:hypothetical protein
VAANDLAALGAAVAGIDSLFQGLRLELGLLAAKHGALPATARDTLIELAKSDPIWTARIGEFAYLVG